MKNIFSILIFTCLSLTLAAQAPPAGCCPDFKLLTKEIHACDSLACREDQGPIGLPGGNPKDRVLIACKNQPQTYYITPVIPGFTYNWTVTGGLPANPTGSSATITWGNGTFGYIQVLIKNADSTCRDTIKVKVCLLDAPVANISYSPTPVCDNTPINFSGAGSVGATTYYWDFGDNTYSNLQNPPPHSYAAPGPYTVILTVSNSSSGGGSAGQERPCGCTDTAMVTFYVSDKKGMDIYTDNCKKMLCPGDTIIYCTSAAGCTGLNWNVNGGSIIGSTTGSCVTVVWDQPSIWPTTVTVSATSCPGSICGNTATLNVPVLYPNLPIQGPDPVCPASTTTYTLPALPGTFYKWTLSGGGTIVGPDSNHNIITINWNNLPNTGPYTITCNYTNPYSGCSGTSTKQIYIKPKFKLSGISPVCVGQTAFYCANGPVATWTYFPAIGFTATASGSSCQQITWNVAGSYSISAVPNVLTDFCSSPAVFNVVVNDTPQVNLVVGPLVVCAGQNVMYSVSSNMNAGTYNWTISSGTIVQYMGAQKDSVLVNFSGNGTISVSQTVNGCTSYTQNINVSVITSIGTPTGPNPACIDQTATYTIPGPVPPGGYTWTLSNALGTIMSQIGNNVTIQWSGGAPTATCVLTATACSVSSSLTVTVNNPANGTITATGDLCTPGVTLTASLSPAPASYDWYRNGVFIINTVSPTYVATLPGYYTVKSPVPCFGKAAILVPNTFTSTVSISANSYTNYCIGDIINFNLIATLVSNNTCTYSYQWYNGGTPVGTNSPTYNVTAPGNYTVVITCGNCKDTSNLIVVTQVICDPGCDNASVIPAQRIGYDIGGPSAGDFTASLLVYTLSINPPVASPCNVVTYSANYFFSTPNSPSSGVFWNFGDGYGATSPLVGMSGTSTAPPHTYTTPGIYVVTATMYSNCPNPSPPPDSIICRRRDSIHYVVPVAANFGANVNCNVITLSNLSTTLPSLGCTISTYAWSYTGPGGASFNNPSIANPILTTIAPGTYNITLTVTSTCGGCSASITYPVVVTAPSAAFTPPASVCAGTAIPFTSAGPATNSYNWNFGDGYQSNLQNTTHAFAAPPPTTSTVTLTVTDVMGCTATASQTITILPKLTVTIPADKFICPGGSYTIATTPGVFGGYQWYLNGNPIIILGTGSTYVASAIGEYYVIVNNGPGCIAKSNKMNIWHHPKPIANIVGETIQCLGITGGGTLYVQNSVSDPNYTYSWTVTPSGTFSPNNTVFNPTITITGPGTYRVILTVTDIVTGCIAKDTFCIWAYNSPAVSITPTGYMCEGIPHTLSVVSPLAGHIYQWNNGATGTSITTGLAGSYYVTVFNPATGCTGMSNWVTIRKRPYVALFPIGCDTLCDTAKIIPPLPLGPGQTYNSLYNIRWFVDGVYNSTGPFLNVNTLSLGNHTIEIEVNFMGDTCTARSGKYLLFIKHCGECDCKESHWGETVLTPKQTATGGGNPIYLQCGSNQKLDCNKTYTLNSTYNCADTACAGKVTFKLQPPSGPVITGTGTITFTTNFAGTYTLTMYGWCGDVICDSCVIKFEVVCCDCKGSKWDKITLGQVSSPQEDNPAAAKANIPNPNNPGQSNISLNCGKTYKLNCNQPYTINAGFICPTAACPPKVTFSLQGPTGPPITGTIPPVYNFTPVLPGTYTLTLYGWCGDKICDSCVIKFDVKCCDCKESKWDKVTLTPGQIPHIDNPVDPKGGVEGGMPNRISMNEKNANIPNPNNPTPAAITLNCKSSTLYKLDCNRPYTLNAGYICPDPACPGKVTYSMQGPTGLPITGTLPPAYTFTPTQSGVYTLTLYGWCGDKICDSCVVKFEVKCACDCEGSKWGEKFYTIDNNSKSINCNKNQPDEVKVKCNVPVSVNASYNCVGVNCPGTVTYSMQPPTGLPQTGNIPPVYTFTPSMPGTYTLTMYGWCGGKICDSCVVKFTTDCIKDSSCCPYTITAKPPTVQTSTISNPAATVANGSFTFTGPGGNLFTGVRAEVVSYTLTDNFDKECINCKSYPFSWASIYQPGVIGSMPPQITMFNSVTTAFNPTGSGMYQNPREVIWTSPTPVPLPSNINLSFLLPPASIIDCCELKARICVKFTFRNNDCKECEVLVCFEVPIKKK